MRALSQLTELAGLRFELGRANVWSMKKAKAIELLGGTVGSAARAIGVTSSAVTQWPDELPDRLSDRVLAAIARRFLAPATLGETEFPPAKGKVRDAA
jgi:hypothetical protein